MKNIEMEKTILEMNEFRKLDDFKDYQKLKVKMLEIDERFGLHDNPHYNLKQSVDFYYEFTLLQIQRIFLDKLLSFIENLQEETHNELKFEKLRKELNNFLKTL